MFVLVIRVDLMMEVVIIHYVRPVSTRSTNIYLKYNVSVCHSTLNVNIEWRILRVGVNLVGY